MERKVPGKTDVEIEEFFLISIEVAPQFGTTLPAEKMIKWNSMCPVSLSTSIQS
jgi:hypothetical protein